jgi:predicted O-methyltransferase YrrM
MNRFNITDALYDYILDISLREHPTLSELREDTANLPLALMQISPAQAQLMQLLLRVLQAKKVLELGTFTGYSTLAMALALPDDGHIVTCDINPEWTNRAHPFWEKAKQAHKIELRLARANDTLDKLIFEGQENSFDFIFIDADKTNYINYYEKALILLKSTGLIAIDNIFWQGKVLDEREVGAQTREIRKLNQVIKNDKRVFTSLLPIGDGLFLIQHAT